MPIRPRAPARPALMTCVGMEAPPEEIEDEALVEAAEAPEPEVVAAAEVSVAEAKEIVELPDLMAVTVEFLLTYTDVKLPVIEAEVVGTAAPSAVMK